MGLITVLIFLCSIERLLAWYTALEATPGVIHPVLTKTLQVRCSIQKHSINSTVETLQGNVHKISLSQGFHFDQLLSIMITKVNHVSGENETIASVTGCSTPVIEKSFLNIVQVEGSTEGSSEKDERGYLRLTWDRPNDKHAANYTCEVSYLNTGKHSVVISTSVNIVSIEPKISDLVTYISDNEKTIQHLTSQINELQTELNEKINNQTNEIQKNLNGTTAIIDNKVGNFIRQNSQSSTLGCNLNSVTQVTFSKPFTKVPTVYLMLQYLHVGELGRVLYTFIKYVNTTGFGVDCGRTVASSQVYYTYLALEI